MPAIPFIGPIFAAIGSAASSIGSVAGAIAPVAGAAASVAGAGASIAAATRKSPDIKPVQPPTAAQATAAVANERQKAQQRAGYASTRLVPLSTQLQQYQANPAGKTRLGG